MNTEPNNPPSTTPTPTASLSRRTFIKKAAGTALIFGFALQQSSYAVLHGLAATEVQCGKYYCTFTDVPGLGGQYYPGGDPLGCTTALVGAGAQGASSCTTVSGTNAQSKQICQDQAKAGRPAGNGHGAGQGHTAGGDTGSGYCVY